MSGGISSLGGIMAAAASLTAAFVMLLCLPGPSTALPQSLDTPSSGSSSMLDDGSALDFYKRLYDFGLGKRASGYGSDYKRIPGYNFGLGKRADGRDRLYSFGLGKRDRSYGKGYSFGIGKRISDYSGEEEESPSDEDADEEPEGEWGEEEWGPEETKRARQMYSFGLGKRARQYSFGIGKRGRTYSFGMGKRYPRYGFGIGKRAESDEEDDSATAEQRKRRDHRFSFGLGKREVSPLDVESMEEKRSRYYDFGLGKRSDEEVEKRADGSIKGRTYSQAGFGRAGRRTYSFGLGKRIPMYDFGLGKRTERAVTTAVNVTSPPESGNAGKN